MAWRSDPGFVGTKVGNPPTRLAKLCVKHGIRTPRRAISAVREDSFGYYAEILTCGHTGREGIDPTREDPRARLGQRLPCHNCRGELAEAAEREG